MSLSARSSVGRPSPRLTPLQTDHETPSIFTQLPVNGNFDIDLERILKARTPRKSNLGPLDGDGESRGSRNRSRQASPASSISMYSDNDNEESEDEEVPITLETYHRSRHVTLERLVHEIENASTEFEASGKESEVMRQAKITLGLKCLEHKFPTLALEHLASAAPAIEVESEGGAGFKAQWNRSDAAAPTRRKGAVDDFDSVDYERISRIQYLISMGKTYFALKRYPQAAYYFEISAALSKKLFGFRRGEIVQAMENLARTFEEGEMIDDAIKVRLKEIDAIQQRRKVLKVSNIHIRTQIHCSQKLSDYYYKRKEFAKALKHLHELKDALYADIRVDDVRLANTCFKIASLSLMLHKYTACEHWLQRTELLLENNPDKPPINFMRGLCKSVKALPQELLKNKTRAIMEDVLEYQPTENNETDHLFQST